MLVAIFLIPIPEEGVVLREEFRDAVDPATALAAFVGEYSPPKNPLLYLAVDSGFSPKVPKNTPGNLWAWDFDDPGTLIEAAVARKDMLCFSGGDGFYDSESELPPATNHEGGLVFVEDAPPRFMRSDGSTWKKV